MVVDPTTSPWDVGGMVFVIVAPLDVATLSFVAHFGVPAALLVRF